MNEKTRLQNVLTILSKTYPKAHIVLSYSSPWELLVAVILSAQCTDVMVNKVTGKLFKKYPTLDVYQNADLKEFENDIRQTGFYHNKAKNILASAKRMQEEFHGRVPKTMVEILTIPGVARKTANVVLGNAYGVVEGIAVDTHVIRLSQRLRLVPLDKIGGKKKIFVNMSHATCHMPARHRLLPKASAGGSPVVDFIKDASPLKIEQELMKVVPKNQWFNLTYRLIDHGRAVCKAQHPKCSLCPLASYCPTKR